MIASIFVVFKVLGVMLLVCKIIKIAGKNSGKGDIINLMGETFTLGAGNFIAKR